MRLTTIKRIKTVFLLASIMGLALTGGCLPKPASGYSSGVTITLYGFSIMKESLEKAIFPAFADKWKREHGQDVHFTSSFAGSETVTNQILQGVKACNIISSTYPHTVSPWL
jgi:sulfate/thiosulfate transport system substrate-binding protein